MTDAQALAERSLQILERLVAFDTTSRGSNLPLIGYVEEQLKPLGAEGHRAPNPEGTKTNLYASIRARNPFMSQVPRP